VAYAPYWLAYADKPANSDTIVLFVGSEFKTRRQEALKLIEEGHTRHLIIPAYGRVSDVGLFPGQSAPATIRPNPPLTRNRSVEPLRYPKHYEDTHVEVLQARKMMDRAGFKSAIFVSSPYHMRRIRMIAGKVFGADYRLTFVPSRFEQQRDVLWFLNKRDLKLVSSEYSKIVWFTLYRFFGTDKDSAG